MHVIIIIIIIITIIVITKLFITMINFKSLVRENI